MKRTEDSLRDLWDNIKGINIRSLRVPKEEMKKGYEEIFGVYSWKFPQHGKGNSQLSPRDTKIFIQDKPKEKHTKTHTNQANKD